jgi:hypothetical protein
MFSTSFIGAETATFGLSCSLLNPNIMKKIALILALSLPLSWIGAQTYNIPDVKLRDMNGFPVSSSQVVQSETATVLIFWRSSSGKCCENLEQMNDAWTEELKQYGVKMVSVCVDCNGSWTQVKPLVDGNGWDFDTYIDVNGDFMRSMCVGDVPCAMLFDKDQNLLCRYNSGCTGGQEFICRNILEHIGQQTACNFPEE